MQKKVIHFKNVTPHDKMHWHCKTIFAWTEKSKSNFLKTHKYQYHSQHSDCFLSICASCTVILHAVIFACLMLSGNSVTLIKESSIYNIFNGNINFCGFVFKCTLNCLLDNMTHYQNRFHKVGVPENAFQRPCSQWYLTYRGQENNIHILI